MSKLQLDGPADGAVELKELLNYNGIESVEEGENVRFLLSSQGVKWETICSPSKDGAVLIYGIYPFLVSDEARALSFCNKVNSQVRYGAMVYANQQLAFRMGADLFDVFSAYETLGRALEYLAGVMARFWVQASATAVKLNEMC